MTDDHTPADLDGGDDSNETRGPDAGLEAVLDQLQAENAALRDQVLRVAADAENSKRRAEREANDARAYAIQKFARDLLGVADNLSRALQHAPRDDVDTVVKNFLLGIELTEKELSGAFERNGLKKVDPERGAKFDPHLHQAMMEQPAEGVEPGSVVQTMQPGYELMGRIVRPALVVVAAKGANPGGAYAPTEGGEAGGAIDTKA
ncbi:MAG: grpE [Caulobacteraceae bacterium]|jgi:molecular chaperone GrpE|nr:grpE [Caulobacteraceae bacterium]